MATSAQTRACSRAALAPFMFLKAIIKVTSRTESFLARKRKSAIMQWKRQFPVALSRRSVSLFPYLPHTAWVRAADVTRARNIRAESRGKSVQFRAEVGNVTSVLQDASPTRFDAGIVSNAFRRDCKYRRPSLLLPTPGCAFNRWAFAHFRPVNQLCLRFSRVHSKKKRRMGEDNFSKASNISRNLDLFHVEISSRFSQRQVNSFVTFR